MKIVIIEDEKITARDLQKTLLSIEPDIEVAALLHSVEEAITYLEQHNDADLIFSDIQLGDGLSFEIFRKVHNETPVVFCTAYDQYLFDAFQASGIDYVLKPFTKESIEKALAKYQALEKRFSKTTAPGGGYADILQQLEARLSRKSSSVIIRHREKIIPLDVSNVAVFYIDATGTCAYTFQQEKLPVTEKMEDLERLFSPVFFRANRQFLINRKAVKDASHHFNRKMLVNLTIAFKEQILIGKLRTTAFINWLSGSN
jgi:two-component system, LytTR family, response regulator LytT